MNALSSLTPQQHVIFDALLPFLQGRTAHGLAVLEGYAGTGKTFLVSALLATLGRGLKVAIAAPTNKAVRVLKDKLIDAGAIIADAGEPGFHQRNAMPKNGCTCRSIHAFLGLKLKELENGQQEAFPDGPSTLCHYDLVIIDECSMIDNTLFEKVLRGRNVAPVLFIGDPAQLPPVHKDAVPSAVLSPVFDRVAVKYRLSEVVRQAEDNPIIRLSVTLRHLIEANVRAESLVLLSALPAIESGPKALIVAGDPATLMDYFIAQRQEDPESDARIIAYTNDRVQRYNQALHERLHGATVTPFVQGERVIVHQQCQARKQIDAESGLFETARLVTSEELVVIDAVNENHPFYPHIAACRLALRDATGARWEAYVALDSVQLARALQDCFDEHRRLKSQSEDCADPEERAYWKEKARAASGKGWALKAAFAPLRHAYAITAHKSQGSTFDCALVDFSDLEKIPDAFSFNRALYVAVTRSREFLAIVVTV